MIDRLQRSDAPADQQRNTLNFADIFPSDSKMDDLFRRVDSLSDRNLSDRKNNSAGLDDNNSRNDSSVGMEQKRNRAEASMPFGPIRSEYLSALQACPDKASMADVGTLSRYAGQKPYTDEHKSFLAEVGKTLLQVAGKGPSIEIKQAAADSFLSKPLPDTEDPGFRKALTQHALNGARDPEYGAALERYGFRLHDPEPRSSMVSNLLAGIEKETDKKTASDAPSERTGRRDDTVRAVEKVMPSVGSVESIRRGTWGNKSGYGSSVAIDERGYFLTARHVVAGTEGITVTTSDGESHKAKVVCDLPDHDLSVVKLLDGAKVPEVRLGPADRKDLMLGEKMIAIGSPLSYDRSVTEGILSSKSRSIVMPGDIRLSGLIQTSAPVNPGNSGGPLINRNGELVGIVNALRDNSQGIAFASNADDIQRLLSKEMSAEKVAGIRHGISGSEVITRQDGPNRQYVKAGEIAKDSPADKAGIHAGDRISKVNGKHIMNRFDIERAMWDAKAGGDVKVTVNRDGKDIELTLHPAESSKLRKAK